MPNLLALIEAFGFVIINAITSPIRLLDRLAFSYTRWRVGLRIKADPDLLDIEKIELGQSVENGVATEIMVESPTVPILAEQCAALLNKHNAKHYVEFVMMPSLHRDLRPVVITVRWKSGLTPSQKAAKFEAALRALVDDIEEHPGYFDVDTESVVSARELIASLGYNPPTNESR